MKLLDFGSANIDHVYRVDHMVRGGETLASARYQRNIGGKGLNQAAALAKAGVDTCFAGAIGEDGLFLRDHLNETGADTAHLRVLPVPTGHALIQVDDAGQNAILLYGGANQAVTEVMIDETLADFGPGDWLLCQNEISGMPHLLRQARARGMQVALNPSPVSPELLQWPLDCVDWLILNEIEGEDLTGCQAPEAMLDALLARLPACRIVLTLGEQGAVYADASQRIRQPAFPARVTDTTAAGDTFTGYFLSAVLRGQPVADALRIAAAAASITVSRPGAGQSIPTADEVAEMLSAQS